MRSAKSKPRFVRKCFLALWSIFLLAGCGVSQLETPDIHEEELNISEEKAVLADCFTYFNLTAWEDSNQDGIWNEEESPMEGVIFFVDGFYVSSSNRGKASSNSEGQATIDTWSPGECMDNNFTIRAETPDGYAPTTDGPLLYYPKTQTSTEYQFGFFFLEDEP